MGNGKEVFDVKALGHFGVMSHSTFNFRCWGCVIILAQDTGDCKIMGAKY
jgi:hypothetical protein